MATTLIELARQTRYPVDAFVFVQKGLDFTVRRLHGPSQAEEDADVEDRVGVDESPADLPERHVSGQQLCHGLRDFAVEQYGLLARSVLRRWNIHRCEDFGQIVFAMVEAGLMFKTDSDDLDDFRDVFDFADAFAPALTLAGAS